MVTVVGSLFASSADERSDIKSLAIDEEGELEELVTFVL